MSAKWYQDQINKKNVQISKNKTSISKKEKEYESMSEFNSSASDIAGSIHSMNGSCKTTLNALSKYEKKCLCIDKYEAGARLLLNDIGGGVVCAAIVGVQVIVKAKQVKLLAEIDALEVANIALKGQIVQLRELKKLAEAKEALFGG